MGPRKTTTRERLITTAAELFWRQGYAQTGVNEIIQRARATSGSFYHFFPAKEDLLLAVIDHMNATLQAEVFDIDDKVDADPIDHLFAILSAYRRHLSANDFVLGSPLASLAAEVSENHPQVRNRLAEVADGWTSRFEDLLSDAASRLPVDTDRGALARFIVSTVEGAVLQARVSRSAAPFDAALSQLRVYFDLLEKGDALPDPTPLPTRPAPRTESPAGDWKAW